MQAHKRESAAGVRDGRTTMVSYVYETIQDLSARDARLEVARLLVEAGEAHQHLVEAKRRAREYTRKIRHLQMVLKDVSGEREDALEDALGYKQDRARLAELVNKKADHAWEFVADAHEAYVRDRDVYLPIGGVVDTEDVWSAQATIYEDDVQEAVLRGWPIPGHGSMEHAEMVRTLGALF